MDWRPMVLKPGENPRQALPRHAERSAVPFEYTLKDIANAANVNYQTVRKAVSDDRLDPDDLRSISSYINSALARKSKTVAGPEIQASLPPQQKKWWKARWPKFLLYRCAQPECSQLLFGPGACAEHGGDRRPAIKFDGDWHIVLLVSDDYVPLHRLIAQTPKGQHTHHRDGNPWNNRWENLEVLDPKEHESRHLGGILTAEVIPKQPARKPFRSEVGGMTKAELQKIKDEAYVAGLEAGRKK